ncbi:MAG: glycosyltransferase family 1 protein [Chloroflexi bacterium]|uniref:Glycosyl transferase n=1 Tax=Candidatus Thermofonsia Clade 3 bacterium TaxID=2364212 RepID=A0A2M8QET4_9CHLR|nr:MAG: glycosyl transferase [Candidatus Thermofonsia Clade 3 bacterium]RMG62666.1 MAG: glycosyltransferase family 1 protein [Chloroflexota bacterium]
MRIALFTETFLPRVDGVTNTLCRLLDHLAARGHESILFAPEGSPARYAHTPVIGLPGRRLPMYPDFKLISPLAPIAGPLRDFAPDLVHTLNPVTLGLAAIRRARAMRVPVVASYHTDAPGFMMRWGYTWPARWVARYLRWVHNQADLNLCPSSVTLEALARQGYCRLKVWGRGVDTALFNPDKRSAAWRVRLTCGQPERPLLLFVGRLSHEKRVHWIYRALQALPDVRLAIVGDGPARAALQRLFFDAPVVFTGVLRGEDLAAAYASADLFVFPAANETLGNVVLEAMASGLPVVAPRSGGLLDCAVHGETALLFEPEDCQALVAAVRALVQDPTRAKQMGQAGRARVEPRTWASVLDGLLDDYRALLAPQPAPVAARSPAPHRLPQADRRGLA